MHYNYSIKCYAICNTQIETFKNIINIRARFNRFPLFYNFIILDTSLSLFLFIDSISSTLMTIG